MTTHGYFCRDCWREVRSTGLTPDQVMACPDHPAAVIDSIPIDAGPPRDPPEAITLRRTGQAPLAFDGWMLAQVGGGAYRGRDRQRWHDLAVYQTTRGTYVVSVTYLSAWPGEGSHSTVALFDKIENVGPFLAGYDPLAALLGFPPGDQFERKRERMERELRQQYQDRVSQLLEWLPGTETRL